MEPDVWNPVPFKGNWASGTQDPGPPKSQAGSIVFGGRVSLLAGLLHFPQGVGPFTGQQTKEAWRTGAGQSLGFGRFENSQQLRCEAAAVGLAPQSGAPADLRAGRCPDVAFLLEPVDKKWVGDIYASDPEGPN